VFSVGNKRAGDAHLVEISVRRERHQAGVLVLPANRATDAVVPAGPFEARDMMILPPTAELGDLVVAGVGEEGVRNRLDVGASPRMLSELRKSRTLSAPADPLLNGGVDGAVVCFSEPPGGR